MFGLLSKILDINKKYFPLNFLQLLSPLDGKLNLFPHILSNIEIGKFPAINNIKHILVGQFLNNLFIINF